MAGFVGRTVGLNVEAFNDPSLTVKRLLAETIGRAISETVHFIHEWADLSLTDAQLRSGLTLRVVFVSFERNHTLSIQRLLTITTPALSPLSLSSLDVRRTVHQPRAPCSEAHDQCRVERSKVEGSETGLGRNRSGPLHGDRRHERRSHSTYSGRTRSVGRAFVVLFLFRLSSVVHFGMPRSRDQSPVRNAM